MGCNFSSIAPDATDISMVTPPQRTFCLSRLEGIHNIMTITYTKEPFGQFLNELPMNQSYLEAQVPEDFYQINREFLFTFHQNFKESYQEIYPRQTNSVLFFLMLAKTNQMIFVLLHIFPLFFESKLSPLKQQQTTFSQVTKQSKSSSRSQKSSSKLASISPTWHLGLTHSINALILALDTFKVAISIASVKSATNETFPIVYVNPFFTILTGFYPQEVEGRNLRFLQANKAEKESIEEIKHSLQEMKPCQISITNYRKDGVPYKALLCLIPIVDEYGVFTYVVGLHFDVTKPGLRLEKQAIANDLIYRIPKTIFCDDNNQNQDEKEDSFYSSATKQYVQTTTMMASLGCHTTNDFMI